jgi:hypothetical protein
MAAHAHIGVPGSRRLIVRLKAFTSRLQLDRELAAGADPAERPELACRAQVLSGWRVRHAFASGLERAVMEAIKPPPYARGAAAPVDRDGVLDAQHELLRLANALRAEPPPNPRATATASILLTDGTGPLFNPHPRGTLREIAFQAAFRAEAG